MAIAAVATGSYRPTLQGADPGSKRAAKVADRMVSDVIAMGWPVGELLGSEARLLDRYQVSRAVFREAVRLIEHKQVARTRRGPGGGLVITEPTVDAVIDAVVLYLYRMEARLDELFEARIVLEEIACELAPARLDEQDLARLRAFVDDDGAQLRPDPRALHALVASITRNPALELFVDVLNRVAMLYSSGWQSLGLAVAGEVAHAHARIAQAVIAGDAGLARHRMRKHLLAEAEYLRRRRSTRQLLPDSVVMVSRSNNGKRAEAVARRITQMVVGEGMQPGELIGTEPALIEREGVSRAVLREAVRLLEHHQIARMRRGPGGGLFVFEPSAVAVTDAVAIYLARHGMCLVDLAELRSGVEVTIAGLAAAHGGAETAARLEEALQRERRIPDGEDCDVVHVLHEVVAGAAGNRVLELVALVLIRLSRLYQIERIAARAAGPASQVGGDVLRAHQGIAAAIRDGDSELARHRMRRHLEAVGALLRR